MLTKTNSRSRISTKGKRTTKAEKLHMNKVAALGCIICKGPATIHHTGCYIGGGRNHMKVIPLCEKHHLFGPDAIDGKIISKRQWEAKYGTEEDLLTTTHQKLKEQPYLSS